MMIILAAVVVAAAAVAAFMMFASADDSNSSIIDIIGNGTIEENGTLNVKLTNDKGVALKDKDVHVSVRNSNGSVVFEESAKTYVNGIANIKLENLSAGEYDVNVTFEGDENYTASSISEKLTIAHTEEVEDEDINATAVEDDTYQSQSNSYSSYQSSYSSPSSYDYDSGSPNDYYDENGNRVNPSYDENGNPTYDLG